MDIAIKTICSIVILFILIALVGDINTANKVKNSIFNSVRSANQNSLYELNGKTCSDIMMLETWLANFVYSYSLPLEEVQIDFLIVQDNPKVYVVKIVGYDHYCFINENTYFSYLSASTIINE